MDSSKKTHRRGHDAERERQAAEMALEQLEWVIGYLTKIRKPAIARALDRNRRTIIERARVDA